MYLEEKLSHLCEFGGVLFEAVEVIFGQDEEPLFPSANNMSAIIERTKWYKFWLP